MYFTKEASMLGGDGAAAAAVPHGLIVAEAKGEGDVHFEEATVDAQRMFKQICPDEEFLPKAPNPEDIVWDGDDDADGAANIDGATAPGSEEGRVAAVEAETTALAAEVAALQIRMNALSNRA
jgi:hypothetical protein